MAKGRANWWIPGLLALLIAAINAFAWIDGGREPLQDRVQAVAVPEMVR